jgi:hypothetical protein
MTVSILGGEELLTFSQAAAILPPRRGGSKIATSTLWRWSRRGSRGVVLRVVNVGGHTYVSREALLDFIAARSAVNRAPQQPTPTTASNRAMRQLRKMGM